MKQLAIYDFALLYDLAIRPGPCEAFYRDLARQTGRPILELACGTGRLTIPLARDGHEMVGLDASPAMLSAAKNKAEAAEVEIALIQGDMRKFDLGRRFGLVIISCNSLAHLTSNDELRSCLCSIRKHLASGGLVAFDITNPDVHDLARSAAVRVRLDLGPNPSSRIAIDEVANYDPVQQVRTAVWHIREQDLAVREVAPLKLRQIFPQELELLLAASGLELAARYGDFARNPLTGASLNQICIATRRRSGRTRRRRDTRANFGQSF